VSPAERNARARVLRAAAALQRVEELSATVRVLLELGELPTAERVAGELLTQLSEAGTGMGWLRYDLRDALIYGRR
jgi:hypothetical protein